MIINKVPKVIIHKGNRLVSAFKKKEIWYLYDKVMQERFLFNFFGRAIYKMVEISKRK